MSDAHGNPALGLWAGCQVTAAGAFVANAKNLGFNKVAIASSVYTLTLASGYAIDKLDCLILAAATTAKQYVTWSQTDDTTVVVSGWNDAGAATDTGFALALFRIGVG